MHNTAHRASQTHAGIALVTLLGACLWLPARASDPDPMAQGLRRGQSNAVALLVGDIAQRHFAELTQQVQRALAEADGGGGLRRADGGAALRPGPAAFRRDRWRPWGCPAN